MENNYLAKDETYYKVRRYSPDKFYGEFSLDPEREAIKEGEIFFDNISQEFVIRIEVIKI